VTEVADKFIDLGVDDGPRSVDGDGMKFKMDRIKKEFSTHFVFDSKAFDIPKGSDATEMLIDYEDPNIGTELAQMDEDLQDIRFNLNSLYQ
jgi:hypothetical protein